MDAYPYLDIFSLLVIFNLLLIFFKIVFRQLLGRCCVVCGPPNGREAKQMHGNVYTCDRHV